MTPDDEMDRQFSRGTKVIGTVVRHMSFGYFLKIPGTDILGLVDRVQLQPAEKYPAIGKQIEAVIIEVRDHPNVSHKQFRLSLDPVLIDNPALLTSTEES